MKYKEINSWGNTISIIFNHYIIKDLFKLLNNQNKFSIKI